MSNTKNTVVCAVTGHNQPIIQAQFVAKAARDGLTLEELTASYVSSAGKRHLKSLDLTKEEVATKFPNIHPKALEKLRVYKKTRKNKKQAVLETVVSETVPEAVEEKAETPIDTSTEDVTIEEIVIEEA